MKKFLKVFSVFLILIITITSGFAFFNRGRISLLFNIGKKFYNIKDNLSSITSLDELDKIGTTDNYIHKDIVYKETKNSPKTLDIYESKKRLTKGSPVILYVHGGSWAYGNKNIPTVLSPLLDAFREEGFTIIGVSYELMSKTINFQQQVSDVKDSIRWIYKNKEKYNFNTDEIGVIGLSAGAHLSLLASYSNNNEYKDDADLSLYSSKVKYVIDFFGPTDLSTIDTTKASSDIYNALADDKNRDTLIEKYSPINYVKSDLPNTLIIHSRADTLVPYENSEKLYLKCKEMGNKVDLISISDSNHDLSNISTNDIKNISFKLLKFVLSNSPRVL